MADVKLLSLVWYERHVLGLLGQGSSLPADYPAGRYTTPSHLQVRTTQLPRHDTQRVSAVTDGEQSSSSFGMLLGAR